MCSFALCPGLVCCLLLSRNEQGISGKLIAELLEKISTVPHYLPAPFTSPSPAQPWQWLKIVTGGDDASVAAASNVVANQQAFAERHGFAHEVHVGNYAHPWIAYWHKIDVLLRELRAPKAPQVLVWFDLDLIVTNPSLSMLEEVLAAYPDQKVILTEDAHRGSVIPGIESAKRLVNTGIILVRKSPEAERVLEKLLAHGREHRNAAYLPQDTNTLHEQDAFNFLLSGPRRHVWRRHIAVIPQRYGALNMNTFSRNLYDAHFQDPLRAEWRAGDFTAHCTGLRKQLRDWCIVDSIAAADLATASADVCRNGTDVLSAAVPSGEAGFATGVHNAESYESIMQKSKNILEGGMPRLLVQQMVTF